MKNMPDKLKQALGTLNGSFDISLTVENTKNHSMEPSDEENSMELADEDCMDDESSTSETDSCYDSDDVLTDKSDFIDNSEDLDGWDSSDGSYDPADNEYLYLSNSSDDSDYYNSSPTSSVCEEPPRPHKRPLKCQGRN